MKPVSLEDVISAIRREDFYFEFQSQHNIHSNEIIGVEALIRWHHHDRGFVPPDKFIPLIEPTEYMRHVVEWQTLKLCKMAAEWRDMGYYIPVAINVPARQILHRGFTNMVVSAMDQAGLDLESGLIEIEITERSTIDASIINVVEKLRRVHIPVSLDDFGTGHANLSALQHIPFSKIKIDRSFVRDINNGGFAIVEFIVALGNRMEIEVVAEGVETSHQVEMLKRMGCNEAQGFYYSTPMKFDDMTAFLATSGLRNK
jgi:EAL domain-containing protein (putative c-di-GMP-specific phosphodiesterase class I)